MTAPPSYHDEEREALERAGEALAYLLARRWRDQQAALAERADGAASTLSAPGHEPRDTSNH